MGHLGGYDCSHVRNLIRANLAHLLGGNSHHRHGIATQRHKLHGVSFAALMYEYDRSYVALSSATAFYRLSMPRLSLRRMRRRRN
jgi:hypothetical protein